VSAAGDSAATTVHACANCRRAISASVALTTGKLTNPRSLTDDLYPR
jgi:hypothetical protein